MKASGLVISILLAVIPAISLLITGLSEQGLITAAVATTVGQVINLWAKVIQERNQPEPSGLSRSVAVEREATPTWKRVLLG